jgi:hypothetical protein
MLRFVIEMGDFFCRDLPNKALEIAHEGQPEIKWATKHCFGLPNGQSGLRTV